jgi:hypothetical protein
VELSMGIEIEPPMRLRKLGSKGSRFEMPSTSEDPLKESLKLLEIKPEEVAQAVLELFGGAISTSAFDGILEVFADIWFPQYAGKPLFGFEPLPPIDDWLVGAAPLLTGAAATQLKNKDLMRLGVGGALYWGAMIIHQMILRAKAYGVGSRSLPASTAPAEAPTTTPKKQAPKGRYQVMDTKS